MAEHHRVHDAAGQQREQARDDERTGKNSDHGVAVPLDAVAPRVHDRKRQRCKRKDREQMDRAPPTPDAQVMDPERARRHSDHERNPEPTDGAMRQRPFGRGKLYRAEPECGQRRKSMQLGGGGGVQQRRERPLFASPHAALARLSELDGFVENQGISFPCVLRVSFRGW